MILWRIRGKIIKFCSVLYYNIALNHMHICEQFLQVVNSWFRLSFCVFVNWGQLVYFSSFVVFFVYYLVVDPVGLYRCTQLSEKSGLRNDLFIVSSLVRTCFIFNEIILMFGQAPPTLQITHTNNSYVLSLRCFSYVIKLRPTIST